MESAGQKRTVARHQVSTKNLSKLNENSIFGSKSKTLHSLGSGIHIKQGSISKNLESREFGRELTTNNGAQEQNSAMLPAFGK